ncbi:MAG: hypothetical protein ACJAS4_002811 [Bacteriovoracaceae bacterium]|jgi:hypothetical protein
MQKILILSILVFPQFALADSWKLDVDKLLENPPLSKIKCSEEIESNVNPYQNCLEEVCGNSKNFTSTLDKYVLKILNGSSSTDPKRNEVKGLIEKYYKNSKNDNNEMSDESYKKLIKEVIKSNPSIETGNTLNLIPFMSMFHAHQKVSKYNETMGQYIFNTTAFEELSDYEKKISKKFIEESIGKYNKYIQDGNMLAASPYNLIINQSGTSETDRVKFKNYLIEIKKIQSEINTIFPPEILGFNLSDNDISDYMVKFDSGSLIDLELQELYASKFSSNFFLLAGQSIMKSKEDLKGNTLNEIYSWIKEQDEDFLVSFLSSQFKEERDKENINIKNEQERSLSVCLAHFDKNDKFYPSDADLNAFKLKVDSLKSTFINKLITLDGISSKSRDELINKIKSTFFTFPFSKKYWKSRLITKIKDELDSQEKSSKISKTKKVMNTMVLYYTHKIKNKIIDSEEEHEETDFEDICNNLEQEAFSDATYTSLGKIMLSHTLINAPESYQEGVINHELAHNMEKDLLELLGEGALSEVSNQNFIKVKSCLANMQMANGVEDTEHYFREDFADYVASRFSSVESKPKTCEYLTIDKETRLFKESSIRNSDVSDTHSGNILRIVRAMIDQGRVIPKACKEAIHSEGIIVIPGTCTY